jgi:hypothetical protein
LKQLVRAAIEANSAAVAARAAKKKTSGKPRKRTRESG